MGCTPVDPLDEKMASCAGLLREASDEEQPSDFSYSVSKVFISDCIPDPVKGAEPVHSHPLNYNKLMKAFARAGEADEVLRLFSEMKETKCKPNVICYNTVMDALVAAGRTEQAEEVFEEMLVLGIVPNISSYNIVVKLHSCYSGQFDLAYAVIQRMNRYGCCPDATTYSTLIAGLCRAGRIGEAWGVLDWMLEEKCNPTVFTYTPIVQGYCSEGKLEEAKKLMATMESLGCPPNSVTYNILIEALCRVGSFEEVDEVLKQSTSKHWKPNEITYNILMNGLCKWGKVKEAFAVFELMLLSKLYPTVVTLNILLECLCRDSKIWEAKCLLERSSEFERGIGVVGYNTVMSRFCQMGNLVAVLKLFSDMLKKGITPNTRTFNVLIHALCKGGKHCTAKLLLESGCFLPNVVTYNTLIYWFYQEGRTNDVKLLISQMHTEKIAPDLITYDVMIDGLCKEGKYLAATNCLLRSLERKESLDLVAGMICRLIKNKKIGEMLYLFEGMTRRGFVHDVQIFDLSIRAFCNQGFCQSTKIFDVCIILDKMLKRMTK